MSARYPTPTHLAPAPTVEFERLLAEAHGVDKAVAMETLREAARSILKLAEAQGPEIGRLPSQESNAIRNLKGAGEQGADPLQTVEKWIREAKAYDGEKWLVINILRRRSMRSLRENTPVAGNPVCAAPIADTTSRVITLLGPDADKLTKEELEPVIATRVAGDGAWVAELARIIDAVYPQLPAAPETGEAPAMQDGAETPEQETRPSESFGLRMAKAVEELANTESPGPEADKRLAREAAQLIRANAPSAPSA